MDRLDADHNGVAEILEGGQLPAGDRLLIIAAGLLLALATAAVAIVLLRSQLGPRSRRAELTGVADSGGRARQPYIFIRWLRISQSSSS
jgi:hypothetical protein